MIWLFRAKIIAASGIGRHGFMAGFVLGAVIFSAKR
jgi:hypothetical protein